MSVQTKSADDSRSTIPAKPEFDDPIIVSSNRFHDLAPYCSSLWASDPHVWGSIMPWEFPQHASQKQEEDYLDSLFGRREIHIQGGITGDKAGYRFLKHVYYTLALWNYNVRAPSIAEWWWKDPANQDLIGDPEIVKWMSHPDAEPETFFDPPSIAMYGRKILFFAINRLRELAQEHQQKEAQGVSSQLGVPMTSPASPQSTASSAHALVKLPPVPASTIITTTSTATTPLPSGDSGQAQLPDAEDVAKTEVQLVSGLAAQPITDPLPAKDIPTQQHSPSKTSNLIWHPENRAFVPRGDRGVNLPQTPHQPQSQPFTQHIAAGQHASGPEYGSRGGKRGNKARRASRGGRDASVRGGTMPSAVNDIGRVRTFSNPFDPNAAVPYRPYPLGHHTLPKYPPAPMPPDTFQARRAAYRPEQGYAFAQQGPHMPHRGFTPMADRSVSLPMHFGPSRGVSNFTRQPPSEQHVRRQSPEDVHPDLVSESYIGANRTTVTNLVVFNVPANCDMREVFHRHGIATARARRHSKSHDDGPTITHFVDFHSHDDARRGLRLDRLIVDGYEINVQVTREHYDVEFARSRAEQRRPPQSSTDHGRSHAWQTSNWNEQRGIIRGEQQQVHDASQNMHAIVQQSAEPLVIAEVQSDSVPTGVDHPSAAPTGVSETTKDDVLPSTTPVPSQAAKQGRQPKKKKKFPTKDKDGAQESASIEASSVQASSTDNDQERQHSAKEPKSSPTEDSKPHVNYENSSSPREQASATAESFAPSAELHPTQSNASKTLILNTTAGCQAQSLRIEKEETSVADTVDVAPLTDIHEQSTTAEHRSSPSPSVQSVVITPVTPSDAHAAKAIEQSSVRTPPIDHPAEVDITTPVARKDSAAVVKPVQRDTKSKDDNLNPSQDKVAHAKPVQQAVEPAHDKSAQLGSPSGDNKAGQGPKQKPVDKSKGPDHTESFSMFGKKQSKQKKKKETKAKESAKSQSKKQSSSQQSQGNQAGVGTSVAASGAKSSKTKQKPTKSGPMPVQETLEITETNKRDEDDSKLSPSKPRGILGDIFNTLSRAASFTTVQGQETADGNETEADKNTAEGKTIGNDDARAEQPKPIHDDSTALLKATSTEISPSSTATEDNAKPSKTDGDARPQDPSPTPSDIPRTTSHAIEAHSTQSQDDTTSDSSHTLSGDSRPDTPSSAVTRARQFSRSSINTHLVQAPPPRNRKQKRRRKRPNESVSPVTSSGQQTPSTEEQSATDEATVIPITELTMLRILSNADTANATYRQPSGANDVLWVLLPRAVHAGPDGNGSAQRTEVPDSDEDAAHDLDELLTDSE